MSICIMVMFMRAKKREESDYCLGKLGYFRRDCFAPDRCHSLYNLSRSNPPSNNLLQFCYWLPVVLKAGLDRHNHPESRSDKDDTDWLTLNQYESDVLSQLCTDK